MQTEKEIVINGYKTYEELCKEVMDKIPKEELKRLLSQRNAELSCDFLGFLEIYDEIRKITDKKIIDLGCYMSSQAYLFEQEYIGVDICNDVERFKPANAKHYVMSIQQFIKEIVPTLNLDEYYAICSYVPDFKATEMAYNIFPNIFIYYPEEKTKLKLNNIELLNS